MINTAILSFGAGGFQIQCVLDSIFFEELENIELSAVIVNQENSRALERARHAGVPVYLVNRELFPNEASFTLAILNKLADLDIELVIAPGVGERIAPSLACAFAGRIIATKHSLYPAFLNAGEEESLKKSLEMGLKLSGSTVFMPDKEGNVGKILYQKAVPVLEEDDKYSLLHRILDEAESEILLEAIRDCCDKLAAEKKEREEREKESEEGREQAENARKSEAVPESEDSPETELCERAEEESSG